MEVHHHPHVEKKSFKEYFLEFIMIFLAVTLGFFAENVREGINNRETERKNMETVLTNLKSDTTQLNDIIQFNYSRIKGFDSMNSFRYQNLTDTTILKKFNAFLNSALTFDYFRTSRAAIDQMKSTDGFRLVKKEGVVDSIFAYEDYNGLLDLNTEYLDYFQRRVFDLYEKLFQQEALIETSGTISKNKELLNEFFNALSDLNAGLKTFYTPHLELQLQKASRLIDLINHQYDLKQSQ